MSKYTYYLANPREEAQAIAYLRSKPALGIEVTVPAIAQACSLGNIDPQHSGKKHAKLAAVEVAMDCPLPPVGATLAMLRPDPDALATAVLISLRAEGDQIKPAIRQRVQQIATADKEASGPWPGPRPLERPEEMVTPISIIGAVCMDHETPLEGRVAAVRRWLLTGHVDGEKRIRERLVAEARAALDNLNVRVVDGMAVVVGSHRLAMSIGYRYAPLIVASNPKFRWQGGPAHTKHTIAAWNSTVRKSMDWDGMLATLNSVEKGWGRQPSIIGSPQGRGSTLTTEQVVEVVRNHMLP